MPNNKVCNNKGVTLVEVMIALVIMLVVFMGLIQASLLSIESNLNNEIRDEAVRIGAEYMATTRSNEWSTISGFSAAASGWNSVGVVRNFRSYPATYTITRGWTTVTGDLKQVKVRVSYNDPKGGPKTFEFDSIVRQPQ